MRKPKLITPEVIVRRALNRRDLVLRHWVETGGYEPWGGTIPRLPAQYADVSSWVTALEAYSKEINGHGYELVYKQCHPRRYPRAVNVPIRYRVNTIDDYFVVIGQVDLLAAFLQDISLIRTHVPELDKWISNNIKYVLTYHGKWSDLLKVCRYFMDNPEVDLYVAQLPIDVHTKFVRDHQPVLFSLLDYLVPSAVKDASAKRFEARFGLRYASSLITIRMLGKQLQRSFGLDLEEFAATSDQLSRLDIEPRFTLVVENKQTFLTLPYLRECIAVLGFGDAATTIVDALPWRLSTEFIYWGDIDAQGFEILSHLRCSYPNIRSVMMDRRTVDFHREFILPGVPSELRNLPCLTPDEYRLYEELVNKCQRLEQEHLRPEYCHQVLQKVIGFLELI